MNKRGMISLILSVAVISGAFLIPRLLLRAEEDALEGYSETAEIGWLNSEPLTLTDKLSLLWQEGDYYSQEDTGTKGLPDQILEQFQDELLTLLRCEAIHEELYMEFDSSLSVNRRLLIDRENRSFSYYVIYTEFGAVAYLDAETGKILQIIEYHPDRAATTFELMWIDDRSSRTGGHTPYFTRMLEGWAQYYGLELQEVASVDSLDEGVSFAFGEILYAGCGVFTDENGSRVGFAVTFFPDDSRIEWHSVSEQIATSILAADATENSLAAAE